MLVLYKNWAPQWSGQVEGSVLTCFIETCFCVYLVSLNSPVYLLFSNHLTTSCKQSVTCDIKMRLSPRLLSSFPALVTRGKAPATVETLSRKSDAFVVSDGSDTKMFDVTPIWKATTWQLLNLCFLCRSDLPASSTVKSQPGECDLLVKVDYSTLNYKDALVVTGKYDLI